MNFRAIEQRINSLDFQKEKKILEDYCDLREYVHNLLKKGCSPCVLRRKWGINQYTFDKFINKFIFSLGEDKITEILQNQTLRDEFNHDNKGE